MCQSPEEWDFKNDLFLLQETSKTQVMLQVMLIF